MKTEGPAWKKITTCFTPTRSLYRRPAGRRKKRNSEKKHIKDQRKQKFSKTPRTEKKLGKQSSCSGKQETKCIQKEGKATHRERYGATERDHHRKPQDQRERLENRVSENKTPHKDRPSQNVTLGKNVRCGEKEIEDHNRLKRTHKKNGTKIERFPHGL